MLLKLLIVVVFFVLSTVLFRACSGGLGLRNLNIISITYYVYIVMVYLGASIIYLGFASDHYIVYRVSEANIEFGFLLIAVSGVVLPLVIEIVGTLVGGKVKPGPQYDEFLSDDCLLSVDGKRMKTVVAALFFVCILSAAYTFVTIGNIPVVEVLLGGNEEAISLRSQAKVSFGGVVYVRNLGMLLLAPVLSFLCQIMAKCTGANWWKGAFCFSILLSVIALTYDLEKAPVVYYLFQLYIVEILLGRTFTKRQFRLLICALLVVLLIGYALTTGSDALVFSVTAGPIGRTVIAFPAVFMLHVQTFPGLVSFLGGAGLPSILVDLLGANDSFGRPGQLVMDMYNTKSASAGLAYSMNTYFPAEAYDNWGIPGYVASILVVGFLVGLIHYATITHKKTVLSVWLYIFCFRFQMVTMVGGFIDYLWSANAIVFAALFLFVYLATFPTGRQRETVAYSPPVLTDSSRGKLADQSRTGR